MRRILLVLIACGLLSTSAFGNIALRCKMTENESNSGVGTLTITNTGCAISSGDMLVVTVRSGNGSTGLTVADNVNAGNYTISTQVADGTNNRYLGIFVMPNSAAVASGSLTVTATLTTAAVALNGLVYSGAVTSSPTDQAASQAFTTATSSPTSGNITTTGSCDVVVGSLGFSTSSTATVSAENNSFNQEFNDTLGTASHQHLHTADRVLTSTATIAYAPTLSATTTGVIAVASYKAISCSASGPPHNQFPRVY